MASIQTTGRRDVAEWGPAEPAPVRVALQVALDAHPELRLSVRLRVTASRAPVRLFLYIDGDLAEAWVGADATYEIPAGRVPAGRHALTARAVDALGHWAGASLMVEVPPPAVRPDAAA